MGLYDIIISTLIFTLLLVLGFFFAQVRYSGQACRHYFVPALALKMLGSIFFCLIYLYYYRSGDTFMYWGDAMVYREAFLQSISQGWELFWTPAMEFNMATDRFTENIRGFRGENALYVSRITAVLSFIAGGSFLATTILFGALSFTGLWALYRVFLREYPSLVHPLAFAVLFIPSVIFWGSGVMKDTITIGCLGWLTYGVYFLFIKKKKLLLSLILVPLCFHLISVIKGFIMAAFLPSAICWVLFAHAGKVKEPKLITFCIFSLLAGFALLIYFFGNQLYRSGDIALAFFISRINDFQGWHGVIAEQYGGSSYTLGEWDLSLWGILKKVPAGINVTFFRPYLTEVSSSVQLITAIESLGVLVITILAILSRGFFSSIKMILSNSFLLFCFLFSMSYGFAAGFASYNFGALARYKIPCMPFFLALLMIILFHRWHNGQRSQKA